MYDKSKYEISETGRYSREWTLDHWLAALGAKSTVANHVHMQNQDHSLSLHSPADGWNGPEHRVFFYFADRTKSNEVKKSNYLTKCLLRYK